MDDHATHDVASLVRAARAAAGWSQAELARRAGTSQPAIARYETGASVPSLGTLERVLAAAGTRLALETVPIADPDDVALARDLLALTPAERLETLRRYAAVRDRAEVAS